MTPAVPDKAPDWLYAAAAIGLTVLFTEAAPRLGALLLVLLTVMLLVKARERGHI